MTPLGLVLVLCLLCSYICTALRGARSHRAHSPNVHTYTCSTLSHVHSRMLSCAFGTERERAREREAHMYRHTRVTKREAERERDEREREMHTCFHLHQHKQKHPSTLKHAHTQVCREKEQHTQTNPHTLTKSMLTAYLTLYAKLSTLR